jgi:hypothetical protein
MSNQVAPAPDAAANSQQLVQSAATLAQSPLEAGGLDWGMRHHPVVTPPTPLPPAASRTISSASIRHAPATAASPPRPSSAPTPPRRVRSRLPRQPPPPTKASTGSPAKPPTGKLSTPSTTPPLPSCRPKSPSFVAARLRATPRKRSQPPLPPRRLPTSHRTNVSSNSSVSATNTSMSSS